MSLARRATRQIAYEGRQPCGLRGAVGRSLRRARSAVVRLVRSTRVGTNGSRRRLGGRPSPIVPRQLGRFETLEDRRLLTTDFGDVPLNAVAPLGSGIYESSIAAEIESVGEIDLFTVDLDAGQAVTLVVEPALSLRPEIELRGPDNASLATATAVAAGTPAAIDAVTIAGAGMYTIEVRQSGDTAGDYSVRLVLNAGLESEHYGGPANDERLTAQDLDGGFLAWGGGGAERVAVWGTASAGDFTTVTGENFEAGTLGDGWTTYSSETAGRVRVTDDFGAADGDYALVMDRYPNGSYILNEAVWTVDLTGMTDATLRFAHADWMSGSVHPFTGDFVDHQNADGVAISADGVDWHPVWDGVDEPSRGTWQDYSIDLAAEAGAAGMTLGADFQIKFQQYDYRALSFAGRGYDEISIVQLGSAGDWYRFTLADGQSTALALSGAAGSELHLQLYDSAGELLVDDVAGEQGGLVVPEFVDHTSDGFRDTYFARVIGGQDGPYRLLVTRDSGLDFEPNEADSAAQELPATGTVVGHVEWTPGGVWGKQPMLFPADGLGDDQFGTAVAMDGTIAIVGAPGNDQRADESGAAYIYQFDDEQWALQQKLTPSDGDFFQSFGGSVAIRGDRAIVGAAGDHDTATRSGAAYIYQFDGSQWIEQQKIVPAATHLDQRFGSDVAIAGNTALVGARGDNEHGKEAGAAYVFEFDGGRWNERQKLVDADAAAGGIFGHCVTISDDNLFVSATEAPAAQSSRNGAVYVFGRDGVQWTQQHKFFASEVFFSRGFGQSLAVDGDVAIVGATQAMVPQGDFSSGAVYFFRFDGGDWIQQQRIIPAGIGERAYFGGQVAISGNYAVGGSSTAWDDAGAAYVFYFNGREWVELENLPGTGGLGSGVAIDGDLAFLGAAEAAGATDDTGGVFPFQLDESTGADEFTFQVRTGDQLSISSATPLGDPDQPVNDLDPVLQLYGPDGSLLADDDNSGWDNRNARLAHTAADPGTYTVRIAGAGSPGGEYVLTVADATGANRPFEVTATDPAAVVIQPLSPTQMTVHFNRPVWRPSLEASDLLVDATPATAVRNADATTLVFDLPGPLANGLHEVTIAAGALEDALRTPLAPYAGSFEFLASPAPRVIDSSVQQGDVLPSGSLRYSATFSEPLDTETLSEHDVSLVGQTRGRRWPTGFHYDPESATLLLEFVDLPEDDYTLTLVSGDFQFQNLQGNDLDGEAHETTTVPSGDGTAGGDFVVHFRLESDSPSDPLPLESRMPLGGLISEGVVDASIGWTGDTDRFTLELDQGQAITLALTASSTQQLSLEVAGPDNAVLWTGTAVAAGDEVVLQTVVTPVAGTFTITVSRENDELGAYSLRALLNAVVEMEEHGGPANDDAGAAQDLDDAFLAVGAGLAQRAAVAGVLDEAGDWYRATLADGQVATLTLATEADPDVQIEWYDAAQTRLAIGSPTDNLARTIGNFVDTTVDREAADYYVHVTGPAGTDYRLTVLRDAAFDAEPNDGGFQPSQPLSPKREAVGYVQHVIGGPWTEDQKIAPVELIEEDRAGHSVALSGESAVVGAPFRDDFGDSSGAAYVYRQTDGRWLEHQKLVPAGLESFDSFGRAVAIDGHTAVVAAFGDDDAGSDAGTAYVFQWDGNEWLEQQKLVAPDGVAYDRFGWSVAVSGEFIVVGASYNDDFGRSSGAAYVYRQVGREWIPLQKLTPLELEADDAFGCGVAIHGHTMVVGARGDDDAGFDTGAVYVFEWDGSQWTNRQKLTAPDGAWEEQFGHSVAIRDDRLIVGSPEDIFGANDTGVAHIYRFDGTRWQHEGKLTASDAGQNDDFGGSVSIDGNTALVGATGAGTSGAAYVFRFDGNRWTQQDKLLPESSGVARFFGSGTALQGETALVGAWAAAAPENESGAAYFFVDDSVDVDLYAIQVRAGDALTITTTTPGDGPALPVNQLDPAVELYDPGGALVAFDFDSGADGRNAFAGHSADQTGTYYVRVLAEEGTTGAYALVVDGASGPLPPFEVVATNPADGALIAKPNQFTVRFNDAVRLDSVQAADLIVDLRVATGITVIDAHTIAFDLPADLADGPHQLSISAGAIVDLQGTPVETFAASLELNSNLFPRVVASSVSHFDVVHSGPFRYTARFNHPLDPTQLDAMDVELVGKNTGVYPASDLAYDPATSTVVIEFGHLPEDHFTLTLFSGDGQFENVSGIDLDGESADPGTVPSGDGYPGGHFAVSFHVEGGPQLFPLPLIAESPRGSGMYSGSSPGEIVGPGDADPWTLNLDEGQTLTVVVDPAAALQPNIELIGPNGSPLATGTAGTTGAPAVLQTVTVEAAGTYTIHIAGADDSAGEYVVELVLNGAVELEQHDGANNDGSHLAQDLDPGMLVVGSGSAARGGAIGTLVFMSDIPVATSDFQGGTLGPDWTTQSSTNDGLIYLTQGVLAMEVAAADTPNLNEAVWSVDLGGLTHAELQFRNSSIHDEPDRFDGPFTGSYHADGVAISVDGNQWFPVFQPPDESYYLGAEVIVDLAAEVQAAGLSLTDGFLIKFQQFGNQPLSGDGRAWYDICITTDRPDEDWYRFSLDDGQTASLALGGVDPAEGGVSLELYDAANNLLATGVASENTQGVIREFVDTTADGTPEAYFVRVAGALTTDYGLTVTRDTGFDTEPDDAPIPQAQPFPSSGTVVGFLAADNGELSSDRADHYRIEMTAGETVGVRTYVPADGPHLFVNRLDPRLELFNPGGSLVASDDGGMDDGRNARLVHVAETSGTYVVRVTDGGSSGGEYVLGLWAEPLLVTTVEPSPSGFVASFNRRLDPVVVNLYDVESGVLGPADVTLVGDTVGPVPGSLPVGEDSITFIATGGPLPADTYTITIRGAADGFRELRFGDPLDGDGDGTPGGDFVAQFAAATTPLVVGTPDFSRGLGQPVNVPADGHGLPIFLRDDRAGGADAMSVALTVTYDPTLLVVMAANLGPDAPADATFTADLNTPGLVTVALAGTNSPLARGISHLVDFTVEVSASAEYGVNGVWHFADLIVADGAGTPLFASSDDAVFATALLGDTTGNGSYSGLDAQRVARVAVGLDNGFIRYATVDPVVIADITGNGELTGLDAQRIASKVVGFDVPDIPQPTQLSDRSPDSRSRGPSKFSDRRSPQISRFAASQTSQTLDFTRSRSRTTSVDMGMSLYQAFRSHPVDNQSARISREMKRVLDNVYQDRDVPAGPLPAISPRQDDIDLDRWDELADGWLESSGVDNEWIDLAFARLGRRE